MQENRMYNKEFIFEFIKNTRISVEPKSDISKRRDIREKFIDIIEACVKECDCEDVYPSLIMCETYNKYSQLLNVRMWKNQKHKYYVLYDCHLEEILKRFVIITLSIDDSGHDVWKLAYELFGEEMLLNQNELFHFYYKLNETALGAYQLEIDSTWEELLIYEIQNSYVLAHEIGHWLYSISQKDNKTDYINISENVESVINYTKALLLDIYDSLEKQFKEKDYHLLIEEQKKIVRENDCIIEECFADAIAYSYVMAYVNTEYDTDEARLVAVKSLFILMMTMQILAMSHMTFNKESFENSTSIRIVFLRNYLEQYYEDINGEFLQTVNEITERFENRISNIILESFAELEERVVNLEVINRYCNDNPSIKVILNDVAKRMIDLEG